MNSVLTSDDASAACVIAVRDSQLAALVERRAWPTMVAGVVLGLVLATWTWARAASISADGAHYMELAERAWREGPHAGMDWYAGPGYPVVAGWLFGLVGDLDFAGRLTSFLFGLATLVGVGVLSCRLFGRAVAGFAVGLLAVHTTFVRHSVMAETDTAYGCWLVWSVLFVWELRHARDWIWRAFWSVLAGLSLGIGYLTRPEAMPLGGLLALWYLWGSRRNQRSRIADCGLRIESSCGGAHSQISSIGLLGRAGWMVLLWVLCLAVATPYLVKLRSELGRWSLSGKERSIILKFVPDKRNYEEVLKLGVSGALLRKPSNLLHWLPYHVHWGLPQMVKSLHPLVLALGGFGIFWRRRAVRPAPGAVGLLVWVSVPFLVFFFLTFPGRRYFMQAMPTWTILAAVGTVELATLVAQWRGSLAVRWTGIDRGAASRRAFEIAVALPLVAMAASTLWGNLKPLNQSLAVERSIGERIFQLAGAGHRVLSFTVTAFYARGPRVPLWGPMQGIVRCHGYGKPLSYEDLIRYVRRHGVQFVVMDHDLRADCPEFLDRVRPEDFQLVVDTISDARGPCLVYRYIGAP